MAKTFLNICRHCGEVFETSHNSTFYCQKEECQMSKASKQGELTAPPKGQDMTLGFIAWVMYKENISYYQYRLDRQKYIDKYFYN